MKKPKPTCIFCNEPLKDKRRKYCKPCQVKYRKDYYKQWVENNPDKIINYKTYFNKEDRIVKIINYLEKIIKELKRK